MNTVDDFVKEKVSLLETQRLLANRGHYLVKPKLDLFEIKSRTSIRRKTHPCQTA